MVQDRPKRRKSEAVRHRQARPRGRAGYDQPLEEALLHLGHVRSALRVAVAALRRQNCELDEDIATLLQRCVCDPLDRQLEKLQAARHLPGARLRRLPL